VHDVLASLLEGVETYEQGIGSDLPLVCPLSLAFVLEIGVLEFGTGLKGQCQLIVSLFWLFVLDATKDGLTINVFATLADYSIADLTNEYN